MKLIDDWRRAWRYLSVQLSALGAAAMALFPNLPEATQLQIIALTGVKQPVAVLALVLFVLAIFGRVVRQPRLHDDANP